MKAILAVALSLGLALAAAGRPAGAEDGAAELEGTVTLSGAWALYPITVKWAEEFQKIHPAVRIDVSAGGAGKGIADCLAQIADIGMVSREIYPEEIKRGAWWVSVTKDAVVPTVNANNPVLNDILSNGLKRKTLIDIWITKKVNDWKDALGVNGKISGRTDIHVYTRSDACGAADTWAKFLGAKQEDLLGVGVYGDPGLADAVRKDALGIGFNNINYVYDAGTKRQVKGIKVLPIDLNQNGRIDEDEDFYGTRDELVQAVSLDKYPSPPARELYFVSQGRPRSKPALEFTRWVLTSGQEFVPESGYIKLTDGRLREGLKKLEEEPAANAR